MFQPEMVAVEAAPKDFDDFGKSSHIFHGRPLIATGNLVIQKMTFLFEPNMTINIQGHISRDNIPESMHVCTP